MKFTNSMFYVFTCRLKILASFRGSMCGLRIGFLMTFLVMFSIYIRASLLRFITFSYLSWSGMTSIKISCCSLSLCSFSESMVCWR